MKVDNYNNIRELLDFSDPDTYYFLQILKRRKDNPGMEKDMVVIDDIFFYNMEQFDRMQKEIVKICFDNNARAYFRINKRSLKKTAFQMLKRVTDLIISENYKAVKNCYSSVSGEFHSDDDKKWVVDIDDTDKVENLQEGLLSTLEELQKETGREPMLKIMESKSGLHIVTRPFNLQKFREKFSNIDVHKDNMVILYC